MLIQIQYLLNHFQLVECFSVMSQWRVKQLGGLVAPNSRQIPPPLPLVWAVAVKLLICLSKYNLKVANSASLYLSLFIAQARPRLPQAPPHTSTILWEYFQKDLSNSPYPDLKWLSPKTAPVVNIWMLLKRAHSSWQGQCNGLNSVISKEIQIHP